MRHLFPQVVSYNCFVELERKVAIPFAMFIKKVLLGKCTGISFVDGIQQITKLRNNMKGALMLISDKLLLRKRAIIETINNELKNIAQVEHSRLRSIENFIVNTLGALAAYCLFPQIPCINVQRVVDTELTLF